MKTVPILKIGIDCENVNTFEHIKSLESMISGIAFGYGKHGDLYITDSLEYLDEAYSEGKEFAFVGKVNPYPNRTNVHLITIVGEGETALEVIEKVLKMYERVEVTLPISTSIWCIRSQLAKLSGSKTDEEVRERALATYDTLLEHVQQQGNIFLEANGVKEPYLLLDQQIGKETVEATFQIPKRTLDRIKTLRLLAEFSNEGVYVSHALHTYHLLLLHRKSGGQIFVEDSDGENREEFIAL